MTSISAVAETMPQFTEHRVPRPGGSVYARDYPGRGPAFVLMHGLPDNMGIYDFLVPYLVAAGRRVVTFDFLGFGASDKPASGYSFAQQSGDVLAVIDALGLDRIVLVAHDASGGTGVNFAIDHPDRLAALYILNAVYGAVPNMRIPELVALFATQSLAPLTAAIGQSPEQLAFLLQFQQAELQTLLSDAHRQRFQEFLGPLITDNFLQAPSSGPAFGQMAYQFTDEVARNTGRVAQMEGIETPVKLIWGDRDPYFTLAIADDFKSHLKNSTLHVVSAGHWLQIDEPAEVAAIMLS